MITLNGSLLSKLPVSVLLDMIDTLDMLDAEFVCTLSGCN